MSGRRPLRVLGALLVVVAVAAALGALLLAGDQWARGEVERRVAVQLQSELATPTPPAVEIDGFPFLTQVVAGRLAEVRVSADDVGAAGDSALVVERLELTLLDVTSTDRFATMTAATVDGRAALDLAALRRLTGLELTPAGGDRVALEVSTSVLGATVQATVTGKLTLDAGAQTVTLTEPTVSIAGVAIPESAARLIVRAVLRPVPVTGLPYGLTLPFLTLSDSELTAGVSGRDVVLGG